MKIICWQWPGSVLWAVSKSFRQGGGTLGSQMKEKNFYVTKVRKEEYMSKVLKSLSLYLQLRKQHSYCSWSQSKKIKLNIKHYSEDWITAPFLFLSRSFVELAQYNCGTWRLCSTLLRMGSNSTCKGYLFLCLANPYEGKMLSCWVLLNGCVYMLPIYITQKLNNLSDFVFT